MIYLTLYKSPYWKNLEQKNRNIRIISYGTIAYIVLYSYFTSNYILEEKRSFYSKIICLLILVDIALTAKCYVDEMNPKSQENKQIIDNRQHIENYNHSAEYSRDHPDHRDHRDYRDYRDYPGNHPEDHPGNRPRQYSRDYSRDHSKEHSREYSRNISRDNIKTINHKDNIKESKTISYSKKPEVDPSIKSEHSNDGKSVEFNELNLSNDSNDMISSIPVYNTKYNEPSIDIPVYENKEHDMISEPIPIYKYK